MSSCVCLLICPSLITYPFALFYSIFLCPPVSTVLWLEILPFITNQPEGSPLQYKAICFSWHLHISPITNLPPYLLYISPPPPPPPTSSDLYPLHYTPPVTFYTISLYFPASSSYPRHLIPPLSISQYAVLQPPHCDLCLFKPPTLLSYLSSIYTFTSVFSSPLLRLSC